jgi:cellulose synthase/poly-beta-1,6-N-acetylglucosamine synthase-like glycosyltransferase
VGIVEHRRSQETPKAAASAAVRGVGAGAQFRGARQTSAVSREGEGIALPRDIAFLVEEGFDRSALREAAAIAAASGRHAHGVLIARGRITEEAYVAALARHCGAAFSSEGPRADRILAPPLPDGLELPDVPAVFEDGANGRLLYSAPLGDGAGAALNLAGRMPGAFGRVVFTTKRALRMALFRAHRARLAELAANRLARAMPHLSAARAMPSRSRLMLAGLCIALIAGLTVTPLAAGALLGGALSLFYAGIIMLRAVLIARLDRVPEHRGESRYRPVPRAPEELPVYSVMAALYREENQTQALVGALSSLEWPASRLQVLLVCEEDDRATLAALARIRLPPGFQVVSCPAGEPRTKPKALDFGLPLCEGEFIVLYDAEDRPDRWQLREAYDRFRSDGEKLVCLQAPLMIRNRSENWLTRMFAMEYVTQFRGMLPALETYSAPLPLGGTSNHFRASFLREAGAWDPHNVTEDADLGIRLARFGGRCGTITLPTWEEAPPQLWPWLRQRTRWLKGWLQTIAVHGARPRRLHRELGPRGTLFFHLTLTSIVVSMLIHPFFLALAVAQTVKLFSGASLSGPELGALGLSAFNLAGGYTTYACLALCVHQRCGLRAGMLQYLSLPAYWLLISLAGWRALFQLFTNPFLWEKTPHGLSSEER